MIPRRPSQRRALLFSIYDTRPSVKYGKTNHLRKGDCPAVF